MRPVHALSIDVEDWNNAAALWVGGRILQPTEDVVRNTQRLLGLIEQFGIKATWFVLGEVAEFYPELVRSLAEAGHEIGVHGFHHHRIHELGRERFRDSIFRAKEAVEDAAGTTVIGYRAVAMSLTRETWWAYDSVVEAGFKYSSSLFPTRVSRHGVPDAPVGAHMISVGDGHLLEIPLTVVSFGGFRVPAAGGGYLRHLPGWFSQWALRRLEQEGRPAVVYLHPYELDAGAELRGLPADLDEGTRLGIERLVPGQFRNRQHTFAKLQRLFGCFSFAPLATVFADRLGSKGRER
jgi:polysaccharide deacetylase family protein (PEP-CTERM system associated)